MQVTFRAITPLGISVLALLCEQAMHPYEMYQLLMTRKDDRIVKIRPGSLYHAVDRLAEQQLVEEVGTDREGNRPERTIYTITEDGRTTLTNRIAEILRTPVREYPQFVLALSEIHNLNASDATALLRQRIEHLRTEAAELAEFEVAAAALHKPAIFFVQIGYMGAVIAAEVAWLERFVASVEDGELEWLTEDMTLRLAAKRNRSDPGIEER